MRLCGFSTARIGLLACVALAALPARTLPARPLDAVAQTVRITCVSGFGNGGSLLNQRIGGVISPTAHKGLRIVLYAQGANGIYYVQPYVGVTLGIGSKGRWQAKSHSGIAYAALLVRRGYLPEAQLLSVPAPDQTTILATDEVRRPVP